MPTDHLTDKVAGYTRAVAKHHVERASETDYTQGPNEHDPRNRWSGFDEHLWFPRLPPHADCSACTTWWIGTARHKIRGSVGVDIVNGQRWQAGYTGTQIHHGARHRDNHPGLWKPGRTLCFYGGPSDGSDPTHVTLWLDDLIWNPKLGDLDWLRERGIQVVTRAGITRLKDVVASHGRSAGPELWPWDYRGVVQARAFAV